MECHSSAYLAFPWTVTTAFTPCLSLSVARRFLGHISCLLWGNVKGCLGKIAAWRAELAPHLRIHGAMGLWLDDWRGQFSPPPNPCLFRPLTTLYTLPYLTLDSSELSVISYGGNLKDCPEETAAWGHKLGPHCTGLPEQDPAVVSLALCQSPPRNLYFCYYFQWQTEGLQRGKWLMGSKTDPPSRGKRVLSWPILPFYQQFILSVGSFTSPIEISGNEGEKKNLPKMTSNLKIKINLKMIIYESN